MTRLNYMNLRRVLFETIWHASSNEGECNEGAQVAQVKQTSYRKPWFAGKAAQRKPALTEPLRSSLAHSPEQSRNPTPPGCGSALLMLREYHPEFRVSSY